MAKQYPLWEFRIVPKDTDFGPSPYVMATRGETLEQASYYMRNLAHRSCRIEPQTHCHIYAAKAYSRNHAPNWLNRPPDWLIAIGAIDL